MGGTESNCHSSEGYVYSPTYNIRNRSPNSYYYGNNSTKTCGDGDFHGYVKNMEDCFQISADHYDDFRNKIEVAEWRDNKCYTYPSEGFGLNAKEAGTWK